MDKPDDYPEDWEYKTSWKTLDKKVVIGVIATGLIALGYTIIWILMLN